ncbi:MAG: hypothetical protein IT258_08080 [Saprospiraceae bacterium]|nr:hypothetical protein [Saprospiraceae bacterium]
MVKLGIASLPMQSKKLWPVSGAPNGWAKPANCTISNEKRRQKLFFIKVMQFDFIIRWKVRGSTIVQAVKVFYWAKEKKPNPNCARCQMWESTK